ncbi:MAG: hypothetical protein Q8P41_25300 [Pseudomonadota bacterium]|nr:hypothetical protein [Pseudomonadota bacterium]
MWPWVFGAAFAGGGATEPGSLTTETPAGATEAGAVATEAGAVTTEAGEVRVNGALVATFAEAPRAAVAADGRLYVLTRGGTVETWEIAPPRRVASMPVPGAEGLFVAGGRVWVELRQTRAVPIAEAGAGTVGGAGPPAGAERPTGARPPTAAEAPAAARPRPGTAEPPPAVVGSRPTATVAQVDRGVAVLDRGSDDGLVLGTTVRFSGVRTTVVPSMSGRGSEQREEERIVATGRVRSTEGHRATVDIARGGRVAVGDRAEVDPGARVYPVAPERLGGVREAGLVVRPLLALGTLGVAMVGEAWLGVAFRSPWYVQARLAPIGVGWSEDGNPFTVAILGTAGYDTRAFSVGLGAGWSMLNSDPGASGYVGEDVDRTDVPDVDSVFAFVQEARLGARDGLRLAVRNTLLLTPTWRYEYTWDEKGSVEKERLIEEGEAFVFGGIAMDLAIPTGDRTDLFIDWGTGRAGATWVEGGVSTWLRGNGDVGSVGLRVGAGYAAVLGNPTDEKVELYGPMVSVGARYRF